MLNHRLVQLRPPRGPEHYTRDIHAPILQVIDSLSLVFLLELDNIIFKFIGPEKHSR